MTTVEWLYKFLYEMESLEGFDPYDFNQKDVFNKAKELEKQQLYNFYVQGGIDCVTQADRTVEDFYNETFKSEL